MEGDTSNDKILPWAWLSEEVVLCILQYLSHSDLCAMSIVSRQMHHVAMVCISRYTLLYLIVHRIPRYPRGVLWIFTIIDTK